MRKYRDNNKEQLEFVICNCCGKSVKIANGVTVEGAAHIEIPWGYFSGMDGENHSIDICEACYQEWVNTFKIPVAVTERTELL